MMYSRRDVIDRGLVVVGSSFLTGFPWFGIAPTHAADAIQISSARRSLGLDVSIGSLVGAGLGEQVYVAYAKAAPSRLITTFKEAMGSVGRAAATNLAKPSREYLAFRIEGAGSDLGKAGQSVQRDVSADTAAFRALGEAVSQQAAVIVSMRQSNATPLREFREKLDLMRKEVEVVRLEQDRANKSTSVYGVTQDEIEISRVERTGEARRRIEACISQASGLERSCRTLAELLSRVG